MTIRERIRKIQAEVLKGAFTPDMARENLMQLTALLGAVNDEQRQADHEYKLVLLGCLQGDEAVNKAKIRAEVTPQFQRASEARDLEKLVVEFIRSFKVYLKSLDTEIGLTR